LLFGATDRFFRKILVVNIRCANQSEISFIGNCENDPTIFPLEKIAFVMIALSSPRVWSISSINNGDVSMRAVRPPLRKPAQNSSQTVRLFFFEYRNQYRSSGATASGP
jgi:hypothetical protein